MTLRTLLFFIDGASWDLLGPWISNGDLPVLKRIKESSAWGDLESVIPTTTNIAIPSFYFGKNPSRLKTFYLSDSDAFFINSETFRDHKYFWEILSDSGYRSLISDLPFTYPIRNFNGTLFSGFFTPSDCHDFVHPEKLATKYPDYPRGGFEFVNQVYRNKNTILEEEIAITKKRFDAFVNELAGNTFDFACFYVGATDLVSHFLWDKKGELLKFYKFLDELLGKLTDLNYFDNIAVVSDHGFSAAPRNTFYINTWLQKEGLLVWKKNRGVLQSKLQEFLRNNRFFSKLFYQTKYWLFYLLKVANNNGGEQPAGPSKETGNRLGVYGAIDMGQSKAYAVSGVLRGRGICINENLVKTEEERKKLISEIKNRLLKLEYSGKPAVLLIKNASDIYSNADTKNFPDLVFLSEEDLFVDDQFGKNIFAVRKTKSRSTGHHMSSPNGILAWSGKNIKKGHYGNLSLLDVVPTLLSRYGCSLPRGIDGRCISEIFEDHLEARGDNAGEELLDTIDL